MALTVHQFPCLDDNYGFLVRDMDTGATACIDTPDADRTLGELASHEWKLDVILNTHWHRDHTQGNVKLRDVTGARVIGPAEIARSSPVDRLVQPGDSITLGATRFEVIDSGGHTAQHVSYHDPVSAIAFVGDTLFAMGCGRLFEGDADQMWASLTRLAALPPHTQVYCAHEYTEANGRFAVTRDPSAAVAERLARVRQLRASGRSTVPTTIDLELATNPFLRAPQLHPGMSPAAAFALERRAKDEFNG